jgi:siroheme synthase-like protein
MQQPKDLKKENTLFPVFLKLETLHILLVGGRAAALEKLHTIIINAPSAHITVVAGKISEGVKQLAALYPTILLAERNFEPEDLNDRELLVIAEEDLSAANYIRVLAKEKGLLVNMAGDPGLSDFHFGSVVQKGDVKIAISTNDKSPLAAGSLKQHLDEIILQEGENILQQTGSNGDAAPGNEVQEDELTKVLEAKQTTLEVTSKPEQKKWPQIVKWCLFAFFFMLLGHALLSYVPFHKIQEDIQKIPDYFDLHSFILMLITGFLAQMVDGSLGMGYGTISTTFLLAIGVSPAIVSSRVHSARVFSSGVSGYSHHRFGNINKKLFRTLVIPGIIGAVLGAAMAYFGQQYSTYVRIPLSFYTLYLGYYIVRKAFRKKNAGYNKVKRAGWLASAGGFMDAFAGGGWGTLVTGTLLSKRRNPRYVIGSVCLAEFFVVFASSITFFIFLKSIPFVDVAGLIIGGLIAAPIAARLVGVLPLKTMFIIVGSFVVITSILTMWKVFSVLI